MSHMPPDGACARGKRSVAPARSSFLRCLRGVGPPQCAGFNVYDKSQRVFGRDRSIWPPACIRGAPNSVFMSDKQNLVCWKDIPAATENDGAFLGLQLLCRCEHAVVSLGQIVGSRLVPWARKRGAQNPPAPRRKDCTSIAAGN
jgi:hypothetical protein